MNTLCFFNELNTVLVVEPLICVQGEQFFGLDPTVPGVPLTRLFSLGSFAFEGMKAGLQRDCV